MIRAAAAAALLLALAACGTTSPAGPAAGVPDDPTVCAADVRQCADGGFVSRNPSNGCAFDPCPGASKP